MNSKTDSDGEEDLNGSVDPHARLIQLMQSGFQVIENAVHCARKSEEQDEKREYEPAPGRKSPRINRMVRMM